MKELQAVSQSLSSIILPVLQCACKVLLDWFGFILVFHTAYCIGLAFKQSVGKGFSQLILLSHQGEVGFFERSLLDGF